MAPVGAVEKGVVSGEPLALVGGSPVACATTRPRGAPIAIGGHDVVEPPTPALLMLLLDDKTEVVVVIGF